MFLNYSKTGSLNLNQIGDLVSDLRLGDRVRVLIIYALQKLCCVFRINKKKLRIYECEKTLQFYLTLRVVNDTSKTTNSDELNI
jgi:hypothetical protein